MEMNNTKTTNSQDLLSCGRGGGLHDKLLLKPKTLQTERLPRSSVLERVQSFLPQMAQANERLEVQMQNAPPGLYDIEEVGGAARVIEMDVSVVELSGSDSDSEGDREGEEEEEEEEVTEENLKLPGDRKRKRGANIQVLEGQGED